MPDWRAAWWKGAEFRKQYVRCHTIGTVSCGIWTRDGEQVPLIEADKHFVNLVDSVMVIETACDDRLRADIIVQHRKQVK